jgi:hypothetical protein
MAYKVKVVQIEFDNKTPKPQAIEAGINSALKEIDGEVTSIENWTPESLRAALVVITYKN